MRTHPRPAARRLSACIGGRLPRRRGLAAALLAAVALPALAASTVELSAASAVSQVTYSGGFANVGHIGEDGSATPDTSLPPPTLTLAGQYHFSGVYGSWVFSYDVSWDQAQAASLGVDASGRTALHSEGHTDLTEASLLSGPSGTGTITVSISSLNTQALDFTLSGPSAFEFVGDTGGGQYASLLVWSPLAGRWIGLSGVSLPYTLNQHFDISGNLGAGLYRLQNDPYGVTADGSPVAQHTSWNYTLFLTDALPVPEPAGWMLWLVGLALPLLRGRR